MKHSAWYCFPIASTVGSRGPSALWQKAQMSSGTRERGLVLRASVSPTEDKPSQCSSIPTLPLELSLSGYPFASLHCGLPACSWQNLGGLNSAGRAEGAWRVWEDSGTSHLCPCMWGN